jgi:hypothetical protein
MRGAVDGKFEGEVVQGTGRGAEVEEAKVGVGGYGGEDARGMW